MTRSPKLRRVLLLIAATACLVLAIQYDWSALLPGPRGQAPALKSGSGTSSVLPELVQSVQSAERSSVQLDREVLGQEVEVASPDLVHCTVLDAASGTPLAAMVKSGDWSGQCAFDGTALVPVAEGGSILASHPGYLQQHVLPKYPLDAPILLSLSSMSRRHVQVIDEDGIPVEGVDIRGLAQGSVGFRATTERGWSYSLAKTGSDGRAEVPTAGVTWLFATLDGRASSMIALAAAPEGEVLIELCTARGTTVTVRNVDGTPASGLLVLADPGEQFNFQPFLLRADSAGLLQPILPLGSYRFRVSSAEAYLERAKGGGIGGTAKRVYGLDRGCVKVDVEADDGTVSLRVQRNEGGLVEVVDTAGALIAPIEVWQETLGDAGGVSSEWSRLQQPGQVRLAGNLFSTAMFGEMRVLGDPGYRIVVSSPGYARGVLDRSVGSGDRRRVVLHRHSEEHYIRVVNRAGEPHSGRVRVHEEACPWPLFDGLPSRADGRVGPFEFDGPGRVDIYRASGAKFLLSGTVQYSAFNDGGEPEVVVSGTASILIPGEKVDPQRYCAVDEGRRVWWGGALEEGLLIGGLLPGRYAVTDVGELDIIRRRIGDRSLNFTRTPLEELLPIELRDGERRVVSQPSELPRYDYFGSIALPEGLQGPLYLYAVPTGKSLPRRAGAGGYRVPLSPSGAYAFKGLAVEPAEFVLARFDQAGWVMPLGSFLPGEDYSPLGAMVVLELEGLEHGLCQSIVSWKGASRFSYSLFRESGIANLGWLPQGELQVLVIDDDDRFSSVSGRVPSAGTLTLKLQADDDTRALHWKRAPGGASFGR